MPYIEQFTPQERSLLDKHYSTGLYTQEEWARIIQRIFEDRNREGAIDRAIQNSLGSRMGREIAGIERAIRDPRIIGKTFQQYFDEMSEEPGIHATGVAKGLGNILWSTISAPAQVMDEIASGHVEKPLQTAVGALHFLPYLRAGAGIGALGTAKSLPGVSQSLGKFATHPAIKWTSRGLEIADIVVAGEEAGIEALGEGLLEIPGTFGPRMADWLRNRRASQQVADQVQDQATGSKTSAPAGDYQQLFDEAFQATADELAAGASFNIPFSTDVLDETVTLDASADAAARARRADMPSADDEVVAEAMHQEFLRQAAEQGDTDAQAEYDQMRAEKDTRMAAAAERHQNRRQRFWEENLSPFEQEQAQQQRRDELSNQFQLIETPTSEQREQFWRENLTPTEQAEQEAQQQQQADESKEFERQWGEFYRDQAGSYPEGRRLMEEEFAQGVRDPIEFRYNQIAAPLVEQYGTATAELHRDADTRLRQRIGEKWYRRYRGRGHATIDERVREMFRVADEIVQQRTEETPDDEPEPTTDTEPTQTPETEPETTERLYTEIDFKPSLSTGEDITIKGYYVRDPRVPYANIVIHRTITDGQADENGYWISSDLETGHSIASRPGADTIEDAVDTAVIAIQRTGEERYKNIVQNNIPEGREVEIPPIEAGSTEIFTETTRSEQQTETKPEGEEEQRTTPEPSAEPTQGEPPEQYQPLADTPNMRLAAWTANKIAAGQEITRQDVVDQANEIYGGTFAEGAYEIRQAYDAVEVGGNQVISSDEYFGTYTIREYDSMAAKRVVKEIHDNVVRYLPTPTRRDLEQIESQQFSTPYHYAFVANWVANLKPDDILLEPSAGTGNLAWWGRMAGNELHVNEISERRLRMLAQSGFQNITNHDARNLNNLMKHDNPDFAPTVVVMNPPFSADVQTGSKTEMLGANMVTEALKLLAQGGRLVAIVSGGSPAFEDSVGMAFNGSQQMQRWWDETRSNYEVRANIKVDGKVYTKFGTEFDTRLLVIDKPLPGQTIENTPIAREVQTIEELPAMLAEVRDKRIDPTATPTTPTTPTTPSEPTQQTEDRQAAEVYLQRRQKRSQAAPETEGGTTKRQRNLARDLINKYKTDDETLSDISAEEQRRREMFDDGIQIARDYGLDELRGVHEALENEPNTPADLSDAIEEIIELIGFVQSSGVNAATELRSLLREKRQDPDAELSIDDQRILHVLENAFDLVTGGEQDAGATTTEPTGTQSTGEGVTSTGERRTEPEDSVSATGTTIRSGQQPGTSEQDVSGRQSVSDELAPDTGQTPGVVGDDTQTTDADIRQRSGGTVPAGQGTIPGESGQGTVRTDEGPDGVDDRQQRTTQLDVYVPIKEKHVGDIQLVTTKNLAAVSKPSTADVVVDVQNPDQLSEAQMAQVKSILYVHEQFKAGEGGIDAFRKGSALAYGTGTGKTRIISGTIIHNEQQGRKRHLVLTKNWDLFSKFKKDFGVIGGDTDAVYRQDKVKGKDAFPDDDGVYMSTYPTLAYQSKVEKKAGQRNRLEQVLTWLVGAKPPASVLGAAAIGTGMERAMDLVYENELPRTIEAASTFFQNFEDTPPNIKYLLDSYSYALQQNNQRAIDKLKRDYESIVEKLEAAAQGTSKAMSATEWHALASQFDGVIALDESHEVKNVGMDEDKDSAAQAVAVQSLLRLLPNARVIYSSATPTTKLVDTGYLERLTLFGPGTPYPSFAQFHAMFDKQIGMQELAFAQLKAKGEFDAVTLDMSGIEYGKVEHAITPEQTKDYNRLVDVWHTIQDAVDNYITENKAAAKRANASARFGGEWSVFWSANQRFWINYLMSIQMNTVLNKAFELLDAGDKVVFQLVNTGEASQKKQIERERAKGRDVADAQLTLVEPIIRYLEKTFPTASMTAVQSPTGNNVYTEATKRVQREDGTWETEVIEDQEMKQIRDNLLTQLNDISMPPPAIDILVQAMRDKGYEIAEISGRSERYVWDNNTGERIVEDNIQSRKAGDIERFLSGELRALVFSEAGGTGQDYHSLPGQPQHHLFVVQTGWRMEKVEQGVGRVHRTGQGSDPTIRLTGTDVPGEARSTMTALQHMRTMGAQAMGSEEAGAARQMFGSGIEQYIGTDIGKTTLLGMFRRMMRERETIAIEGITDPDGNPYRMSIMDILDYFGLAKTNEDGSKSFDESKFKMETFLNRVYNSYVEIQRAVFDKFTQALQEAVDAAAADGTLDTGAEVIDTVTANIVNETVLTTDQDSGAETKLVEIDAQVENSKFSWQQITEKIQKAPVGQVGQFRGFLRMPRGAIVAAFRGADQMVENQAVPRVRIVKVSGRDEFLPLSDSRIQNAERLSGEITPEIQQEWEAQFAEIPDTNPEKVFVATGLVTDNWRRLSASSEQGLSLTDQYASTKIVRVQLDDGSSVLGKFVPEGQVPFIYQEFGIEQDGTQQTTTSTAVTPDALLDRIMDGENIRLENNWTLALTTRENTPIIMLRKGNGPVQESTEMHNLGLRSISGTSGLEWFVPSGDSSVLEALLRRYPARDVELNTGEETTPTDPDDEGGQGAPPTTTPPETPEQRSAPEEPPRVDLYNRARKIRRDNPDLNIRQAVEQARTEISREGLSPGGNRDFLIPSDAEVDAVEQEIMRVDGTPEQTEAPQTPEEILSYLQNTELTNRHESRDLLEFDIGEHGHIVANKTGDERGFDTFVRSKNVTITINGKKIVKNRHGKTVKLEDAMREAIANLSLANVQEVFDEPTDPVQEREERRNTARDRMNAAQDTLREHISRGWDWINTERGERYEIIDERLATAPSAMIEEWIEASGELTGTTPTRTRAERILADNIGSWMGQQQQQRDRTAGIEERTVSESEHLQALNINPADYVLWTAEQKLANLQERYGDIQLREAESGSEVSQAEQDAYNNLIAGVNEELGTLSDVVNIQDTQTDISQADWDHAFPQNKAERNQVRAQYIAQVKQIIEGETDSNVQVRLRELNKQLVAGDYFGLHGRTINTGADAALIAQFIRNPVVESTLLLLRKGNKIKRAEWLSLGKRFRTTTQSTSSIQRLLDETGSDSFILVHNHPSAIAKYSAADKSNTKMLRDRFGEQFVEDVIIDDGTYARTAFGEDEPQFENELKLDIENGTIAQPEFFGAFMKTPDGWTTLMILDDSGKVVSAMDIYGMLKQPANDTLDSILNATPNGTRVHVMGGRDLNDAQINNLEMIATHSAVESAWVGGLPMLDRKHEIRRQAPVSKAEVDALWQDWDDKTKAIYEIPFTDKAGRVKATQEMEVARDLYRKRKSERGILEPTTTDDGLLSDYAAEREFAEDSVLVNPRQDTELTFEGQDSFKNKTAKGAVQLFSQIDEELGKRVGEWLPAMRKGWNDTMAVFESGRRGLEKLRSKPGAKATPFEAASNDLDLAMIDALTRISNIRNITNPVLQERKKLINELSKMEGVSKPQLTSDINEAVSDYREHNKAIEQNANLRSYQNDDLMAQVKEYADKEKEAWKQIIRQSDEDIITLVKAAYANNEKLTYPNGEPITPLPIDGFHYDLERDGWVQLTKWNDQQGRMRPTTEAEQEKTYTTAEVFAQAERFYVPHHYTKQHLLTRKDRVNKLLEELNYADANNDVSDIDDMVGIQHDGDKYIFKPTSEDFTAVEAVIQRAKQYWNNEDASVRQYINAHDDGTLARFGHLEQQRKTDDRHYDKDIEVHIKMIEQATRRMSLIAYFGQDHGIIGKSPRFKARMMQMTRYSHTPEEAALLAMYTAMGADKIGMFEHMYDLGSGTPKQDFDILGRWKDKDTGELKDLDIDRLDLSTEQKEILRRMGLLEKDSNENWRVVGSSVKARHQTMQRHFADYSSTIAGRLKHFMNALNATADGPIRSLTDDKTNKLVSKVNSATTMLTLGPRTAAQNLSELPNLIAAAGMGNFIKGLKFITNPDSRQLVKMLSSALDHGHRYMAETKGEQWYLQSPLSFFAQSELLSREVGVAVGWVNAKDKIQAYLKNPSQATRYALDDVKINRKVIDAFKAEAGQLNLEQLFTEAEQRILHGSMPTGGFQKVGASPASNKWVDILGQELQRSAVYMSQDFLKRYDAYSLPPWLAQRHPFVSLFFKYRSWGFQNHELLARRWRQAWRQGKTGNWTPFLNMSLAAGVLTPLGIGALGWAFTVFQALDDDDPFALDMLKTFTAAQSFGMASILIDAVAHAGENPFRLEHSLRGQYSGPALSIATRILAPVFTGDLKEVLEQTSRRLPISREAHYFGLGQVFENEE